MPGSKPKVGIPATAYNIDPATNCWVWAGKLDISGYARLTRSNVPWRAHRYSWTLANGPIPDGLVLDHLCRNRACINPAHLEPVTRRVNIERGDRSPLAEACIHGHPKSVENIYMYRGAKHCRPCRNEWDRQKRNVRFPCPIDECVHENNMAALRKHVRRTHGVAVGTTMLRSLVTLGTWQNEAEVVAAYEREVAL